jgi:demethylmenaquinone methyltransferase / 2-methoxy-6-polyprenyl-1,4-benzoquinol methylase
MKKKDASTIASMFNAISPTYDFINRLLSFGQDIHWRKKMARHLPKKTHLFHLDLATGTGDQIISLWESCDQMERSIGLDPAEKMLEIGREKIKEKAFAENISLVTGEAENIPYPGEHFDAVTISFGIRNTSDTLKSLKEMYRVLKPSGKCLILEFSLPENKLAKSLHLFYLRKMIPKIGGFFSKSPESYRYLNQTIETFPYGKAFLELLKKSGFEKVESHPLSFGAVTLYVGEKACP